ncbi:DUF262 domain-containing protein, partial [Candidatus Saccharibacteria bacterium]|nr:DUF262 domain-containing protein [Candidatus Saccharibacteria bacterium]
LTDELYIKMNSRGKQLTEFENFKAEFESELEKTSQETAKRIALKIDSTWTDLLWSYKDAANTIDERFLKLFYLVCQIICYRSGDTLNGKDVDSFWLLNEYFNYRSKDVASNISFLESFFDGWAAIAKNQPLESFFTQYLTFLNFDGKIKLSARAYNNNLDLFGDAAISEKYTLPKLALFYAFTLLITRRAVLSEEDFRRRIRIVNNLIQNSADEISDNENRVGGNRMPAILRQIDSIILKGEINRDDTPSFNAYQLEEESSKLWLTNAHPEIAPVLFRLEDHDLLYGQIGIVGVDNVELFPRFTDLFQCSLDKVNCALMAINNYAQKEKRYTLQYQLGSSSELNSWRTLFHHGSNEGYENTKATLLALLKSSRNFSEEILDGIIDHFLIECEKNQDYNWRYYYIKYSAFRPNDYYGKYFSVGNYDSLVITTKSRCSESAYSPFLKAAQESIEKYLYLEYFHAKKNILVIGQKGYNFTKHSICIYEKDPAVTEDYYGFKSYILKQEMPLEQSIDSVDRENRIEKLIQIINSE